MLECLVEFISTKPFKSLFLNPEDQFRVVVAMISPFMLPEEGLRPSGLALGGPIVVHVIKKVRILLKDGEIKLPVVLGGLGLGPQAMDGEGLAALRNYY